MQNNAVMEMPMGGDVDKVGKRAEDYTLKDWLAKLNEEVVELQEAASSLYSLSDEVGQMEHHTFMERMHILEEGCDVITVVCSMLRQMGATPEEIACMIHNVNVKNDKRGYLKH